MISSICHEDRLPNISVSHQPALQNIIYFDFAREGPLSHSP